jgi:hypothetical protein
LKTLKELQLFHAHENKNSTDKFRTKDYLLKPEINPYLIYSILKKHFGPPNCFEIDEDKQQWEWTFLYKDFYVTIYDWKLTSTSITVTHINSEENKSQLLAETIEALLIKESVQHEAKLKVLIREAKHKVLENPFVTYYSTAENLLQVALFIGKAEMMGFDEINEQDRELIKLIGDSGLRDKHEDLFRSAFLMFMSSFEGFINILYELYLKPELRRGRIYDRISREQIDLKIRMIPVYCSGFRNKTIDEDDIRFKNYLKLVNLRNDYVHANLIKSLERYIVVEDDYTFIIENDNNSEIPKNINELTEKHVLLAKNIIDNLVELIFESMEPKIRREFKEAIYTQEIEVIEEEGSLLIV